MISESQAFPIAAIPKVDRETQWQVFIQLKELGASVRQLQRLTGIDRGIIQKAR